MRVLTGLVGFAILVGIATGTAVVLRETDARPAAHQGPDKVIAYYFHWTTRCQSCLDIERHSRDVMRERFVDELEAGRLEWHAYNMEQPEYEHFQAEFELSTPSLVLVRVEDGAITQWKVLGAVWELVEIPEDLQDYVEAETRAYLGHAFGPGRGGSARGRLRKAR
jgi:hypothetical protein